jgi:hypothetical protein
MFEPVGCYFPHRAAGWYIGERVFAHRNLAGMLSADE